MIGARGNSKSAALDTLPRGLGIRDKLLIFTLTIAFAIIFGLASTAFFLTAEALRKVRLDGFRSLRQSLSEVITRFLGDHRRDIATQAESQTFRYAAAELCAGYKNLVSDLQDAGLEVNAQFIENLREQLRDGYRRSFRADWKTVKTTPVPGIEAIDQLSWEGVLVQYVYLLKNPSPISAKEENNLSTEIAINPDLEPGIRTAFVKTMFAEVMDRYHPAIQAVVRRNGYSDLLLVDNAGNVVYTYHKRWDLGTNVFRGWQATGALKKAYLGAWYSPIPDDRPDGVDRVMVTDLERYTGAYDLPVLFMSCAIADRLGSRQAVLVHEIASRELTDIVTFEKHWPEVGLGNTGQAFIIGPDHLLRTESRFLEQLPDTATVATSNLDGTPGPRSSILAAPLNNLATARLFSDEANVNSGEVTFLDERRHEALGLFAPIAIPELDWGLVVRIDTSEAFQPASDLARSVATVGLIILVVGVCGTLFFAHFLLKPIGKLVTTAEQIGSGNISARAPVITTDEVGFLATRFNYMIDQVEERNQQVRKILETVNEGLLLIGPDLIIQPSYSRATTTIFRRELAGLHFLELLNPSRNWELEPVVTPDILSATAGYLDLLFSPKIKDKLIQQTNPLTEVEYNIRDENSRSPVKIVEFQFNRVFDQGKITQIMVTVLDSTTEILLSRQIRENEVKARSLIEMLFGIIHIDAAILAEFLDHTEEQIGELLRALESEQYASRSEESSADRSSRYQRLLEKLSRSIHLLKGNASMIHLSYFEKLASDLEDKIATVRTGKTIAGEEFLPITSGLASIVDQVNLTRDLVQRLIAMQTTFAKKEPVEKKTGPHEFSQTVTSLVDQVAMNRDLIQRLVAMQSTFGRKQKVGSRFEQLAEFARTIAERNDKQIDVALEISLNGEDISSDLIDPIQSILTQFIRNAVTHGIESPKERVAKMKPAVGKLRISASRSNDGSLYFSVWDDGKGLNSQEIKERAVKLAYASTDTIQDWTNEELKALLFRSGFTTLDYPTRDGGRGVGLDAVRDLATQIGGSVAVNTEQDIYCEFRLRIPGT
ncbi:MAG: two-component system, chemotaxis family, sensor kinase CheA [Verrucomicrobiota bacterium]|jgi:two-component system, chemotaxis family, sensor kinase CheA